MQDAHAGDALGRIAMDETPSAVRSELPTACLQAQRHPTAEAHSGGSLTVPPAEAALALTALRHAASGAPASTCLHFLRDTVARWLLQALASYPYLPARRILDAWLAATPLADGLVLWPQRHADLRAQLLHALRRMRPRPSNGRPARRAKVPAADSVHEASPPDPLAATCVSD